MTRRDTLSAPKTPRARPDLRHEETAARLGARFIAGVDEVGRGPLCGPVVAAAVLLDPASIPEGIDDSKRLSHGRRERLFDLICQQAIWGIGEATVEEIDEINILQASHLAMRRAIARLEPEPDFLLIDGHLLPPGLPARAACVVRGDAASLSIAAASILAKVYRDRLMVDLAQQYPGYGWERNAGYPTKEHLGALLNLGVTPHHRRSFKPVHNILYQDVSINP